MNLLDLPLAVVSGSVALGFGEPFFRAAQAEIDLRCRLDFARGARVEPGGLGDSGPLIGAAHGRLARPARGGAGVSATAQPAGERSVAQVAEVAPAAPVPRPQWRHDAVVVARAVLPHPGLWWSSLGTLRRLARRGWWHRPPSSLTG